MLWFSVSSCVSAPIAVTPDSGQLFLGRAPADLPIPEKAPEDHPDPARLSDDLDHYARPVSGVEPHPAKGALPHAPIMLMGGNGGDPRLFSTTIDLLVSLGYDRDLIFTHSQPQHRFEGSLLKRNPLKPVSKMAVLYQSHSRERIESVQQRVRDISEHTGAKVDVITGSMGVTDLLSAVIGSEPFLGKPTPIGVLVAAVGAYGALENCTPSNFVLSRAYVASLPIAGHLGLGKNSAFMKRLWAAAEERGIPAEAVVTLLSLSDDLFNDNESLRSSQLPGQDAVIVHSGPERGHYSMFTEVPEDYVFALQYGQLKAMGTGAEASLIKDPRVHTLDEFNGLPRSVLGRMLASFCSCLR